MNRPHINISNIGGGKNMLNITDLKKDVESVITNGAFTHEQAMMNLSAIPLNYVEFFETTKEFRELFEAGCLCTMT